MPTILKTKNSVTTTVVPTTLQQGELAVNITDKKMWVGNAATTPVQLLGDGGSGSFTSIAFGAGTVSAPSITFTGDTNTGIYSPAADTIAFTEGGVESMRIDSAGNVGVGTTSIDGAARLDVQGGRTYLTANSSGLNLYLRFNAGTAGVFLGSPSSDALAIYNASGTERMRIDSNGNVGVNLSNPGSYGKFAVNGEIGVASGNPLIFYNAANTTFSQIGSIDNSGIAFYSTSVERMRITSAGLVGIGTTSPAARLEVHVAGVAGKFVATNGNNNQLGFSNAADGAYHFLMGSTGVDTLQFSNSAGAERMRITSGGCLAIGTTTQSGNTRLTLQRDSITGDPLVSNIYNSAATSQTKLDGRILRISSNASGADANIQLTDNTSHNYYFGGNFGGAYVVANTNGVRLSNGGTSWASDSDERVKDIIEPITDAANKVSTLRAVIGKYKTDEEGKRRSFLIAQDVQAVLPEAVFDQQGTLMLAYTEVIPLLVAAIKELKSEIDLLKGK